MYAESMQNIQNFIGGRGYTDWFCEGKKGHKIKSILRLAYRMDWSNQKELKENHFRTIYQQAYGMTYFGDDLSASLTLKNKIREA